MKNILLLTLSISSGLVLAADLKPAFTFNNAKVLPVGVRNLSYKGVMINGNEKYSNDGSTVVLANPLNKNISFKELIDGKMDPADKGAIQQAMYSIGANPEDTFGETVGQVNVEAIAHLTVFAWGITPKVTLGTAIPVLKSSVNVKVGMQQTNAALHQSFLNALEEKGADKKAAEFDTKMMNPINAKAVEYGYKAIQNEDKSEVGDIRLIAKFLVSEQDEHRITLQSDLTLPTGKTQDPDKLVSIASGDGQTDVGMSVLYDYSINEPTTISLSTGYTVQMKDTKSLRIPERESSKITPDVDANTSRKLGNLVFAQANVGYMKNITATAGYTYQNKEADTFEGSKFDSARYGWMSNETNQEMHSMLLSVGYETVTAFKAKRFVAPLTISLNHTTVLKGKNVIKDPITSLDFSLFF